ncbi:hypothetical protein PG993_006859 [Apiospora rasikravindrae]|uniref:F-box domain-containing protein n=1 Tax=Apiospora rasikravindrae TaxID=990691 RepID=A0ABR1SY22_9PEZI
MDKLPVEILGIIAGILRDNSYKHTSKYGIASHSAISSTWQHAIEPWTFESLRIRSDQLNTLSRTLSPRRCRYIRRIYYTVIIPFDEADVQPTEQKARFSEAFTDALRRLFRVLAENNDSGGRGRVKLEVVKVRSLKDIDSWTPRSEYLEPHIGLVDYDDLPVVHSISGLKLSEDQKARKTSLLTGPLLAARLPNLSSMTLEGYDYSSTAEDTPLAVSMHDWRHRLAVTLADERFVAGSHLRHVTLEADAFDPNPWRKEGFVAPNYCVANEAGMYDPLGAALRNWSQTLSSLQLRGSFDGSLFWPSGAEPPEVAMRVASPSTPRWPYLEKFITHLSVCSPDGMWYFDCPPGEVRRSLPNDGALQALFAAWVRALSHMPALKQASLYWSLKVGDPRNSHSAENHWAVSFLAPGIPHDWWVHQKLEGWEDGIAPDEARHPRLLFDAMQGWRPKETTMDMIHEIARRRFPGTELITLSVDPKGKVTRE